MSSIDSFVEPVLENYKYSPITINKVNLTINGPVLNNSYIFVGEVSDTISKILEKNSNENAITKKELQNLEDYFGKDYRDTLLIANSTMHGGDATMVTDDNEGEYDSSFIAGALSLDDIDDNDDDAPIDDNFDDNFDDNEFSLFSHKIKSNNAKKSIAKIEIQHNKKIIYIYDYILQINTIEEILQKINYHLGISENYINLSYQKRDSIMQNCVYQITYHNNSAEYYSNILLSFFNVASENITHSIPTNPHFQKKYVNGQIIIHDLRKMLLADFVDFNGKFTIVALNEFLKASLVKGFYGISDNEQRLIYEGFVMKYFPACTYVQFKESLKDHQISKKIHTQIAQINKLTENVKHVFEIKNEDFAEFYPSNITIANCNVKSSLISKELSEKHPIFDLRLLFKLFVATKEIPFLVYYDVIEKTKQIKYHNDTMKKFPYLIHNWQKLEIKKNKIKTYLSFKILKHTLKDDRYNVDNLNSSDYTSLHLFSHGGSDLKIPWNYTDMTTFAIAQKQITHVYTTFTKELNKIDPVAFIGYKIIPYPASIEYITIKFKFDIPNGKIASFKELEKHIIGTYPQVFTRTPEFETTSQKMYIGYIRNSPNNLFIVKDQPVNKLQIINDEDVDLRIINIEIDNNYHPRIVIQGGIKNYNYFMILYNFITRILINYIVNIQPKNQKVIEKIVIDKKITNSRLRQLQLHDEVLFNFRTNVGENPYSRICQQHKQPSAYTREEFIQLIETINDPVKKEEYQAILDNNQSSINVLIYENKTYPGTNLYYTCSDNVYKYPGFQTGSDKHPTNYCLPCCKKMPSVTKNYSELNNNMKQYLSCIGQSHLIPKEIILVDNQNSEGNIKTENYIKIYNKDIGFDRLCHLPIQLAKLFDIRQNYSYLSPSIDSYFIYGTVQGKWALLNAVLTALGVIIKYTSEEYFNHMFNILALPENIINYDLLANGLVKQIYPSIYDFKKYILETSVINEYLFFDFIRISASLTFSALHGMNFNIIIIGDEGEHKDNDNGTEIIIDFVDKDPTTIFRENRSIIILRQNGHLYYPITGHKNNIFTSLFTNDDKIIRKLKEVLSLSKTNTRSINGSNAQNNSNYISENIDFNIQTIESNNKYINIVTQIVNEKNMVYEIYAEYKNNKFILPVQLQNLSRRYPVIKMYEKTKQKMQYPSISQFITFWEDSTFTSDLKTIIMNEKNEIVGFYNTQGLHFKIYPPSKDYKLIPKKYTSLHVVHRSSSLLSDETINESIFENKKSKFTENESLINYKYSIEIFNLFKLEIANYIASEKNEKLRKILSELLLNPSTKLKDIIKISDEYPIISFNDREILKKIFERPINKRAIDDTQRYSFDTLLRINLIELCKMPIENKEKIVNILHKIAENVITTEQTVESKEFIKDNIANICGNYNDIKYKCENSTQCFWNKKDSSCKLIMTANDYVYYLQMIVDDFISNEFLRESIIYNTISPVRSNRNQENNDYTIITSQIIDIDE
jgi:hypothetical protein